MAAILVGMGRREGRGAESITPMYAFSYMPESSFTLLISRDGRTNNTESALETEITRNESQIKQICPPADPLHERGLFFAS